MDHHLSVSMLTEKVEKARALAKKGLATDYIILTNHPVTSRCRVFDYDWIVLQVKSSARLRMMAPRLYGLGDLNDLLGARTRIGRRTRKDLCVDGDGSPWSLNVAVGPKADLTQIESLHDAIAV